jgi:hypothetical protein
MLALKRIVNEAAVDDGNQCMALHVGCELELAMGLLDMPLFLKFGGSFAVV